MMTKTRFTRPAGEGIDIVDVILQHSPESSELFEQAWRLDDEDGHGRIDSGTAEDVESFARVRFDELRREGFVQA